ncbi:MAG TPA: DUF2203 domain-containing protein [Actinomycetota bacterium]|nr:DUF2203 domain-containing protein [Actinomycetota bacterium]
MGEERVYSVEDANALLPELREMLPRIRRSRQELLAAAERLGTLVAADGGGHDGRGYWSALSALRRDLLRLAEAGVVLRDPETGLVDFPAEREGRPVFLCWRLGEERVAHWHEPDAGFGGRRPL